MRFNDGSYPAGVHAGTPEAPWNTPTSKAHFHCTTCGEAGGVKDLAVTRKVDGVEENLCAICAEDEGYTDCAACGKWGGEEDVLWCPDRRKHYHEACGKELGLARCADCGDLHSRDLMTEWRGDLLDGECFGELLGRIREQERKAVA